MKSIEFTKVNHDANGNPRYVCHFLNIATDYDRAIKLANSIGGRKFHNEQYGGGIVFQSYNVEQLNKKVLAISETRTGNELEQLPNYHAIEVRGVGPTNANGPHIKITSNRFKQTIKAGYSSEYPYAFEAGQNWLEQNGFDLIGQAEGKDCYIILSSTFKPLK